MHDEEKVLSPSQARYKLAWAKWLATNLPSLIRRQEALKRARGGRFGILTHDDNCALLYQIIEWRVTRARYALEVYGITIIQIRERDTERLDRYRQRAHRAIKLLTKRGLLLEQPFSSEL